MSYLVSLYNQAVHKGLSCSFEQFVRNGIFNSKIFYNHTSLLERLSRQLGEDILDLPMEWFSQKHKIENLVSNFTNLADFRVAKNTIANKSYSGSALNFRLIANRLITKPVVKNMVTVLPAKKTYLSPAEKLQRKYCVFLSKVVPRTGGAHKRLKLKSHEIVGKEQQIYTDYLEKKNLDISD